MAIPEKIPATACPLMNRELNLGGSLPTRPNRLPCSTAPNTGKNYKERRGVLDLSEDSLTQTYLRESGKWFYCNIVFNIM